MVTIKNIYAGKPDAKDEVASEGYLQFLDSYIKPIKFDVDSILKDSFCFITGYKGTGKTALLYYLEDQIKSLDKDACISYIFFKGDYTDSIKQEMENISKRLISSLTIEKDVFLDNSDFESIWRWLFYQRVWEDNKDFNLGLFENDENWKEFDKIINKIKSISKRRRWGVPQKLTLSSAINSPNISLVPKIEVDFTAPKVSSSEPYRQLEKYITELDDIFIRLNKKDIPYYIFVDELEAYYGETKTFNRDLKLIRDLIFTVKKLNIVLASKGANAKIVCSIRKEILNSINRFIVTKELNKVTSGYEIPLVWNYNNTNSFEHPILKILTRRILMAEKLNDTNVTERDIVQRWFPEKIDGIEPANYILNHSWNKPRDIVRLILIAKSCLCSDSSMFSQATFDMLKKEYSKESLVEIKEEMRALYSEKEIDEIISCLTGFRVVFNITSLKERIKQYYSSTFIDSNLNNILNDLYRLGIIGNYSSISKSYRWQHKGDDQLIISEDWSIMIHPALQSALSVSSRHDSGLNIRNQLPKIGEVYEVEIVSDRNNFFIVNFLKNGILYNGIIYKKFMRNKGKDYKINDKLNAKTLTYNGTYKNWTMLEEK